MLRMTSITGRRQAAIRNVSAACAVAGASILAVFANAAADAKADSFCPAGYELLAGLCIAGESGGVVRPAAPHRPKTITAEAGARMCSAWDVHVTTHIEDFGHFGIWSSDALAAAYAKQLDARKLCINGHHDAGLKLYQSILGEDG